MTVKRLLCLAVLLAVAGGLSAERLREVIPIDDAGKTVRMVQEGIADEIDISAWLDGNDLLYSDGSGFYPPRVYPGQAPDPYPRPHVWARGIEQLGVSAAEIDGIHFLNGTIWVPTKKLFVVWKIRIPNASLRQPEEFAQDLNVGLWVDWNKSQDWERSEQMIQSSLNIMHLFPTGEPYLDIEYLTWFQVPKASAFLERENPGVWFVKEKFWTRAMLSYHDHDASPNGESVFGDFEDYQVSYQETVPPEKKIKR